MNLIPFKFQSNTVRVVEIDGDPWFVARDVMFALGYSDPKTSLRLHCKGVPKLHPLQTAGGTQKVRLLNEADVLRLIVSSHLPAAQLFEKWVFEEVLPTLRKQGHYAAPRFNTPQTFADALQLAADLERTKAVMAGVIAEQAPKVAALERIAEAEGTFTLTEAAKVLGMHRNGLIQWASRMRWIYKLNSGPWLGYQHHIDAGLLEHKVFDPAKDEEGPHRTFPQVRVTAKGLTKLAELQESNRIAQDRAAREARERLAPLLEESSEEAVH